MGAFNCNVYPVLFGKFAVVLVSSPEYSGLASILQENLFDRWKWFRILQIFRVLPWLMIEIAVFVVDCPNYLGYLSEKVRKHGFLD